MKWNKQVSRYCQNSPLTSTFWNKQNRSGFSIFSVLYFYYYQTHLSRQPDKRTYMLQHTQRWASSQSSSRLHPVNTLGTPVSNSYLIMRYLCPHPPPSGKWYWNDIVTQLNVVLTHLPLSWHRNHLASPMITIFLRSCLNLDVTRLC